jgi:hypothetical protein
MVSESARMSSAAEARFRIQAPNSSARFIKIIALDSGSDGIVKRLAEASWNHAAFFTARIPKSEQGFSADGWLTDHTGATRSLINEVATADLVVMVATAGVDAQVASIIGEACSLKRVMTTALVVGGQSASDEALSKTLAQIRPWSLMVVIADADDYIEDMLLALRA